MPTWSMVVSRPSGNPGRSSSVLTGASSRQDVCDDHSMWSASRPGRRTRPSSYPDLHPTLRLGRQRRRPGTGGSMSRSVIVSGARTPMGRLLGSLKDFSAADLGGVAIKAALERAGISGDQVDYVIMGQVIQAGGGQNPARPAAVAGGIPMSVPSFTLNMVCLSGIDAIALTDTFDQVAMGALTEQANRKYGLTREEQDEFAAASHQKAAAAQKNGLFDDEITPVSIPQRKGD